MKKSVSSSEILSSLQDPDFVGTSVRDKNSKAIGLLKGVCASIVKGGKAVKSN